MIDLRDRFVVPSKRTAQITDLAPMSESYAWLIANARIGPHTRAARLTIAAMRDTDNHRAEPEALEWLRSVANGETKNAGWAREILEVVG